MSKAADILEALGGLGNIVEIEPCVTRLRAVVRQVDEVDKAALRLAGCHGVMMSGPVVQVVVGPEADLISTDLEEIMLAWARPDDLRA